MWGASLSHNMNEKKCVHVHKDNRFNLVTVGCENFRFSLEFIIYCLQLIGTCLSFFLCLNYEEAVGSSVDSQPLRWHQRALYPGWPNQYFTVKLTRLKSLCLMHLRDLIHHPKSVIPQKIRKLATLKLQQGEFSPHQDLSYTAVCCNALRICLSFRPVGPWPWKGDNSSATQHNR